MDFDLDQYLERTDSLPLDRRIDQVGLLLRSRHSWERQLEQPFSGLSGILPVPCSRIVPAQIGRPL
jgi:hypothetical protein